MFDAIQKEFAKAVIARLSSSDLAISGFWVLVACGWLWLIARLPSARSTLWAQVAAVLIVASLWVLTLFVSRQGLAPLSWRMMAFTSVLVISLGIIALHFLLYLKEPVFPKGTTGILVLRIANDQNESLQRRLVGSLNHKLQGSNAIESIDVYPNYEVIDERLGRQELHERARQIGKKFNAKLVVWGQKVDERRFYPRITVVDPPPNSSLGGTMGEVQDISHLELPRQVVDEPISLAYFSLGFTHGRQGDYARALKYYEVALKEGATLGDAVADMQIFAGVTAARLGSEDVGNTPVLSKAVNLLELASAAYSATDKYKFALAQSNLGMVYTQLRGGIRSDNLGKAIEACEKALSVFDEHMNAVEWARVHVNLGNAYGDLGGPRREDNLRNSIESFRLALRVRTKANDPVGWALVQNNLGLTHRQFAEVRKGEHDQELATALTFFNTALTVRSKDRYPKNWAETQSAIGSTYAAFVPSKTNGALEHYGLASEIITRSKYPYTWALLQVNLATTFVVASAENARPDFSDRAVSAAEAALEIIKPDESPDLWAGAEMALSRALFKRALSRPAGAEMTESFKEAIDHLTGVLAVFTKEKDPDKWATAQYLLAVLYAGCADVEIENVAAARSHAVSAMEVWDEQSHPQEHRLLTNLCAILQRRTEGRDLPGSLLDPPQYSPMNRSGMLQWTVQQLQSTAVSLGLKGQVKTIIFGGGKTYSLVFEAPDEDLENPGLARFSEILESVTPR